MFSNLKTRARIESGLALLTAALFILTLFSREWIEALTGWDPDHGNGSLEWVIVAALLAACAALTFRARSDWRKLQTLPA
jgi:ABC-type transport system involved in cytochrome c biogenesis permease subunit